MSSVYAGLQHFIAFQSTFPLITANLLPIYCQFIYAIFDNPQLPDISHDMPNVFQLFFSRLF